MVIERAISSQGKLRLRHFSTLPKACQVGLPRHVAEVPPVSSSALRQLLSKENVADRVICYRPDTHRAVWSHGVGESCR